MICLICRETNLVEGSTFIPLERGEFRLLIRNVPAWVCPFCGEAVLEEEVAIQLVGKAEFMFSQGMHEGACEY